MNRKQLANMCLLTLYSCQAISQTIASDSRGKDVLNFYKSKSISVPFNASTTSAKITWTTLLGGATQYYVGSPEINVNKATNDYSDPDKARFTMSKSYGLNLSVGVGNIISNLSKVSTFHPTFNFSIGFGRNIDAFNNWDKIYSLSQFCFYSWNLSYSGNVDNVIIYDTLSKIQNRQKPYSNNVSLEGTIYFPKLSKTRFPIALSSAITYGNGSNISDLKSFQKNKPNYANSDIISLGDVIGKIGDIKAQNTIRGRISLPIFLKPFSVYKSSIQVDIIPYHSFYGKVNTKLQNLVGLYFNATNGDGLFKKNSSITQGLGLGMDWSANSHGLSNYSIFFAGSFDIHDLFVHPKKSQDK